MRFVDRIKEGVEAAPDIPFTMKDTLLKEIASQNANSACKRLLAALPPDTSLLKMIETCSRAPIEQEREKARIHASALAAALTKAQTSKGDNRVSNVCFKCGQVGHFKKQCPQKNPGQQSQSTTHAASVGMCKRCDKFGHKAADCRSKFKRDGTPLREMG